MFESIAFFLSGSLLGLTLITAVLVAVILLLVRLPGAPPGMGLMALAFAVNLLRYLLLLTLPPDGVERWLVVESVHGAMPLLTLLAAWRFVGKDRLWPWAAVAWLAMVGWLWFATTLDNPVNRVIPPYLLDGLALVAAGVLFWGHGPQRAEEARRPVGLLLILWGLHQWDFPWLLASGLSLSVGYLLSQLLSVGLAIAIILMISRHQRQFATQARAEISASALKAEASEKQLEAILDRLTDGVVALDEAGLIQVLNPAAQSLFGRWQEQLLGQPGRLLLPDPRQPALPGGMIAALIAAGTACCVCKAHRSDGTPLAIELSVSEVVAGGHCFRLGVLRDISAHHQAEAIDELVLEINQRVLQGEGLEALTPSLCERLVDLFDLNLAWVASRGQDGAVSILGSSGPDALTKALRSASHSWTGLTAADEGPTIRAIRTGSSERVDADSPLWSGRLAPYAAGGAKYALAIPLRAGLDIKGALTVYAPHPLGAEMIRHLEGLAVRIGVAAQVIADQRRLRLQGAAMAAAANAFLITDGDGHIEWVNDAFIRLSGYSLEEAQGSTPKLLRSGAQTDAFYRDLWATIKSGHPWRGELVERRKDGSLYTVEQTVTPMLDEGGVVRHFVAVHEDITNRKQAEERITYLSSYDAVTGLPNRALFRERLRQAITRAEVTGHPLAVLFLDLDHLSRINDSLGHEMGDRLLVEIVERLTQVGRTGEILARVGGDEFAMILTDQAGIEQAEVLARRMIGAVVRPCDLDGHVVHMGASIGIALYPEDGADPDSLIKNADTAMYRAIHEAPNGFRFFSTKMNDEMRERVALERDLRRALGRDEFELHYQPQFDATSGKIVGLEALLRWNHPEQGMIAPGRFIPLAEETGLIIPLGDLVLRMACRQIRDWVAADVPMVPVAVNLSAIQLQRQGLVEDVQNIIDDFAIDPRWLELELTESGVMDDAVAAERILRALDKSGIKIAIDDFGTGYSSLSYLKRFPVQKLKIDQSFVRSLAEDENDAAIARAIITLGHSLGMIVVSEGVELPSQLAYLQGQGCDVIQGFLFSRPVPARDIPQMMAKGREM